MEKSERFGMVLSPTEKLALQRLAERERLSKAAVLRRLIWREMQAKVPRPELVGKAGRDTPGEGPIG